MGRQHRRDYPGAWHHVMNQGTAKTDIFRTDADRRYFYGLVAELRPRFGVEVHAYVLMGNHYHLLVRSRRGELSAAMHWLGTHYARYFNARHRRVGAFFRSRFTNRLIEDDRYLAWVPIYIHLNPVNDGFVDEPERWLWSSYPAIVGLSDGESWLVPGVVARGHTNDEYRAVTECHAASSVPMMPAGRPPTTADEVWKHWAASDSRAEEIETAVAEAYACNPVSLRKPSRVPNVARTLAIALLVTHSKLGRGQVAARYGLRSTQGVDAAVSRARRLSWSTDLRLLRLGAAGLAI